MALDPQIQHRHFAKVSKAGPKETIVVDLGHLLNSGGVASGMGEEKQSAAQCRERKGRRCLSPKWWTVAGKVQETGLAKSGRSKAELLPSTTGFSVKHRPVILKGVVWGWALWLHRLSHLLECPHSIFCVPGIKSCFCF